MDRNTNPTTMVLDYDVAKWLLSMARIGVSEAGGSDSLKSVEKHARKFNPHYAAEAKQVAESSAYAFRQRHLAARNFAKPRIDKLVYVPSAEFPRFYERGLLRRLTRGYSDTVDVTVGMHTRAYDPRSVLDRPPTGLVEVTQPGPCEGMWGPPEGLSVEPESMRRVITMSSVRARREREAIQLERLHHNPR